jgi:hypothetical protein
MGLSGTSRILVIFVAGCMLGFLGAVFTLRHDDSPTGLALKASYMANQSDRRPAGVSATARKAALIWDARNADGFEWGHRAGIADIRYCPGDHGPFFLGCAEAARGRALAMGGPPSAN